MKSTRLFLPIWLVLLLCIIFYAFGNAQVRENPPGLRVISDGETYQPTSAGTQWDSSKGTYLDQAASPLNWGDALIKIPVSGAVQLKFKVLPDGYGVSGRKYDPETHTVSEEIVRFEVAEDCSVTLEPGYLITISAKWDRRDAGWNGYWGGSCFWSFLTVEAE